MLDWFESIAGPNYAPALMWTFLALIGLFVILMIVRLVRRLRSGTYISGGRERRTRLAVLDAAAIDEARRLVLIRRDDVEHLLLIGGPSDLVVEQNIAQKDARQSHAVSLADLDDDMPITRREPAAVPADDGFGTEDDVPAVPVHRPTPPVQAQVPRSERPAVRPQSPQQPRPVATPRPAVAQEPALSAPPRAQPRTEPAMGPAPDLATAAVAAPAIAAYTAPQGRHTVAEPVAAPDAEPNDFDDALLSELEASLEEDTPPANQRQPASEDDLSLDEEMSRLLGDLSHDNRR